MLRSYRYRLDPTKKQQILLNKTFGCCRFVYNLALQYKIYLYKEFGLNISNVELVDLLPSWKIEFPWLTEVSSQALQQSVQNVDAAYNMFFKGINKYPKFKNKYAKQSFKEAENRNKNLLNNKLFLTGFRKSNGINIIIDRPFKGKIKNVTISRTPTDKYYASILVETGIDKPVKQPVKAQTTVGIDLGIKDLIILDSGVKIENPKYLAKELSKLKYLNRQHSKHQSKTSRKRLNRQHEKIANKRKDHHQKVSTYIVKNHDTIIIEDLVIANLMKKPNSKQDEAGNYLPNGAAAKSGLNRAFADAGLGMFISMLKYKAEWQGKNIIVIDRFAPSSKKCHYCGELNQNLTLAIREWQCQNCGETHDRDINAAKNIKQMGLIKHCKSIRSTEHRLKNRSELPRNSRSVDDEVHLNYSHNLTV